MKTAEGGSKKYTEKVTVKSSALFALAAKCDTKLQRKSSNTAQVSKGILSTPWEVRCKNIAESGVLKG